MDQKGHQKADRHRSLIPAKLKKNQGVYDGIVNGHTYDDILTFLVSREFNGEWRVSRKHKIRDFPKKKMSGSFFPFLA